MPIISHKFNSVQQGVFMDVVVSAPGSDEKWSVAALWDTGANVSVICKAAVFHELFETRSGQLPLPSVA